MGKIDEFKVILTGDKAVYTSGDVITGNVVLSLNKPITMRGIRVHILGEGKVEWDKSFGTYKEIYKAKEAYTDDIIVLYGKQRHHHNTGDNPTHPAGSYTYPFQYKLPPGCPATFNGNKSTSIIGWVRYTVTAVIDKPWEIDREYVFEITVYNSLDLNHDRYALTSPSNSVSTMLCCMWCASGPINISARLNRGGYVPGETILIDIEVENGSGRQLHHVYGRLYQTIFYLAAGETTTWSKIVSHIDVGSVAGHDTGAWNSVPLTIPSVPPSGLVGCRIMDIRYCVRVGVRPPRTVHDTYVEIPMGIGDIPLAGAVVPHQPIIPVPFPDYPHPADAVTANSVSAKCGTNTLDVDKITFDTVENCVNDATASTMSNSDATFVLDKSATNANSSNNSINNTD